MNNITRISTVLILLWPAMAFAQPKVTNVDANPAGKSIAVTYDLSEEADVSIYVSTGNSKKYRKISSEYLDGECGKRVEAGTHKRALWHVLDENNNEDFQGNARFKVKAKPSFKPFVLATGSYSLGTNNGAGGLMAGAVGVLGFYVRGETSFSALKECAYIADADGKVDGVLPFYSGKQSSTAWQATGGLVARLYIPLYLYVGAGYGQRELYWEMTDGQWVKNAGGTYSGLTADVGLMGRIKHVAIMAGVSSIAFKYTTVHVGVGWAF